MTNREKYHFDDFTLDNYKRLIELAKEKGFEFILHKDEFVPDRKDIIWRHDVEFEPDIALKMAQIEHDLGVHATYFFQLHSECYNLFDDHYRGVFHQIKDLGHHVGFISIAIIGELTTRNSSMSSSRLIVNILRRILRLR